MRRGNGLKYWLTALAWSAVILIMSGRAGTSSHTGGILTQIFHLHGMPLDMLNHFVRRSGHILAYGLLGVLYFQAVRGGRQGWMLRWSVLAIVLVAAVASLDEWHQSTIPERDGVPTDVIFDCASAALAQVVWRRKVQ